MEVMVKSINEGEEVKRREEILDGRVDGGDLGWNKVGEVITRDKIDRIVEGRENAIHAGDMKHVEDGSVESFYRMLLSLQSIMLPEKDRITS